MPSLLLKFLFENYVLVLLCFVTTQVESLLSLALLRVPKVPQVPQGAIPGTHHLPSCTPGTPGPREQSLPLFQIPIFPLPPPRTPGTPETTPTSPQPPLPQVPQVPQ